MSSTDASKSDGARSESAESRVRLCVIVTVDITILNLCRGRFEYLMKQGFDVTVVCASSSKAAEIEARGVCLHTAPLTRAISPLGDLMALWNLYWFLRRERFDVIEISTPKASLIGAVASWLVGAPCVVHLLRGLAYQEQGWLTARLLRWSQRVACRLSHRVVCISRSMMEQAVRDGLCGRDKIVVLGCGSSNGVDLQRFSPPDESARMEARRRLGIPEEAVVAGFVGRMTGDKGVAELVDAFTSLNERMPSLYLLLVGDYEARDHPPEWVVERIAQHNRIKHVGWQSDTLSFFSAMDFLVLPSYREGFGTVVLEAAAMELPAVVTNTLGGRDVVIEDKTGFCVPIRDVARLERAIEHLAESSDLRGRMGRSARRHVEQQYECSTVWSLQEREFRRLLADGS